MDTGIGSLATTMDPVLQALVAAGVNWLMTALGAAGIFLAPGMSRKAVDAMLGFAAGVMLAYGQLSGLLEPITAVIAAGA